MSLNAALLQALADEGLDLSAAIRVAARVEAAEKAEAEAREAAKRAGNAERQRRFKANRKGRGNAGNAGNALPPPPSDIYSNPPPPVSIETDAPSASAKPEDVSEAVWSDWKKHRKAKRAQITATAMAGVRREAEKAGWAMEAALVEVMARGWTSFKAEWVEPRQQNRNGPAPPGDFLKHLMEQKRQKEEWERRQAGTA